MVHQMFTDKQQIVSAAYISCVLSRHTPFGLDSMLDAATTITCLSGAAYEQSVYLSI